MKLLFILFFVQNAFSWDPKLKAQWTQSAPIYRSQLSDATFATMWGGMRRAIHWQNHRGNLTQLKIKGFRKELPVYTSTVTGKKDLYVFYPGVFGKPDGRISPQMIDRLEEKDAHIAVIPNIIAETYLLARPEISGDPLENEYEYQTLVFDAVLDSIGKERIKNIHIVAESLGTFQAMTVRRKVSSISLLWPPLHLARAIHRFDELIGRSRPKLAENCSFWWKWPYFAYELRMKSIPETLSLEDKNCLGAWVIGEGFVGAIRENSETYFEAKDIKGKPIPETFTSFVSAVLPDFSKSIETEDKRLSLASLLASSLTPRQSIRFMSSKDDFLNVPEEWDELKKIYPELSERIYLFDWGGHSGPLGVDGLINVVTTP